MDISLDLLLTTGGFIFLLGVYGSARYGGSVIMFDEILLSHVNYCFNET